MAHFGSFWLILCFITTVLQMTKMFPTNNLKWGKGKWWRKYYGRFILWQNTYGYICPTKK